MRVWGIRIAIMIAAVTMNLVEGAILPPLFLKLGINLETTLMDEFAMGLAMGLVICVIQAVFRLRYEQKLKRSVDELNHHVRNSMQVILNQQALCPHCDPADLSKAMERVDWALREILPAEIQPKRDPETKAGQRK